MGEGTENTKHVPEAKEETKQNREWSGQIAGSCQSPQDRSEKVQPWNGCGASPSTASVNGDGKGGKVNELFLKDFHLKWLV